ncbi:amidohydrolase family protein [Aaosphaeria arxii CBS 175.79]|uniref:6-methylsalicylate decarboxylase n=1 Tax=Aaosphaeria arxii CBS 175.79 TaxID=1450172 RepID=A0A6A5X7A8_9PLEO|nr:amidohydrolase family protein [Aaosphaeria arxii CBS 175.79]KAF2008707.1 amidohydrolase family protein [Aaosphaeria arxii CBS 175.79]
MAPRIDVHHHILPPQITQLLQGNPAIPKGLKLPQWTAEMSALFMEQNHIDAAIFSLPVPLSVLGKEGVEAAALCREVNGYMADLRVRDEKRFGYFAALPSLEDVNACIHEIRIALDEKGADGVTLFTSYRDKYLGHPDFAPVWEELHARAAVVFIHPTMEGAEKAVTEPRLLPRPLVDWTHETTRTAVHLVTTGTLNKYDACKVILSHAGGTLPFIAGRVADLAGEMALMEGQGDFVETARSFYMDLALAGYEAQLKLTLDFAAPGHILYGSDFPFAGHGVVARRQKALIDLMAGDEVVRGAKVLFPRFFS